MNGVFTVSAFLFAAIAAVVAFLVGLLVAGVVRKESGAKMAGRGAQAAVLAIAGSLVARVFIAGMHALLGGGDGAGLLVGWGFFLWPGAIDTIARIFGAQLLTSHGALLWIASGVGAFVGMMDGAWRTHPRNVKGAVAFLLDVTWGLAGSTNGALLHIWNTIARGGHAPEENLSTHRYTRGFAMKSGFAFVQGAVMTSMSSGPGSAIYAHENTHVWQNRIFGPFFTMSYLFWMVLFFIPGVIAGAKSTGPGNGIMCYCYFCNPWEAWGYAVGAKKGAKKRVDYDKLIWSDSVVAGISIPFFAGVAALTVLAVALAV